MKRAQQWPRESLCCCSTAAATNASSKNILNREKKKKNITRVPLGALSAPTNRIRKCRLSDRVEMLVILHFHFPVALTHTKA